MKIVVLGRDGQVGRALLAAGLPGEVVGLGRAEVDFARPEAAVAAVARHAPEMIINAAAYTAVDRAESEPELAHLINAETPGALARHAAATGALFLHYSTDYVFDGEKPAPYVETDATGPLNVYGRSKLLGEQAVEAAGGPHLIFRTSWVHAPGGSHFAGKILALAQEREDLRVIDDQVGAPTSAGLIARVTAAAIARHEAGAPIADGVYHLTASGKTSWHGYALQVIAEARRLGLNLRVRSVLPVASEAFPSPARRPKNSRLDTGKLMATLGLMLPDWRDDLGATIRAGIWGTAA